MPHSRLDFASILCYTVVLSLLCLGCLAQPRISPALKASWWIQAARFVSLDLRWFHDFQLKGGGKDSVPTVTTAVDAFNILNHPNYPTFVGDFSSPFFGG